MGAGERSDGQRISMREMHFSKSGDGGTQLVPMRAAVLALVLLLQSPCPEPLVSKEKRSRVERPESTLSGTSTPRGIDTRAGRWAPPLI